jgi:hypothetical protein
MRRPRSPSMRAICRTVSRLIAGIVGAVAEVHPRAVQRTRAPVDGPPNGFARGAGGLGGGAARRSGAGFSGYVG